jgi:hypothetical protein
MSYTKGQLLNFCAKEVCSLHTVWLFGDCCEDLFNTQSVLNCAYHDLNAIELQDEYFQSRPEELLTKIKLVGVKSYFPFFLWHFFITQTVLSST